MMAYIDHDTYQSLYGEIPEADFNRLSWESSRRMDAATSGIDNVRKLKVAFPDDEYDAETVRRCAGALVSLMKQLEDATQSASMASGYIETENGLQGKVIASRSAGNESISYATGNNAAAGTIITNAMADKATQEKLFADTIREYLSGVYDANGVSLLYAGRYPYVKRRE